jgi:D-alanyl-D-alanine dipeptidase
MNAAIRLLQGIILCALLVSCGTQPREQTKHSDTVIPDSIVADTIVKDTVAKLPPKPEYSDIEKQLLEQGLVDVCKLDSSIIVVLKYATTDNFMKMNVYGELRHAFLQPDVAERIVKAQEKLRERNENYHLLIYDAARPLRIQRMMWDSVQLPKGEKQKYLSNPLNGSLHNYGAAVDVTIATADSIPLDMGTGFDFFGEEAQPVKEKEMLEAGKLSLQQVQNRQLLREVMRSAGLWGIQTEWWHFNACRREDAKVKYKIVE